MAEGGNIRRESFLECREQIGRSSPELWPERLPGAWDMWKSCSAPGTRPAKFRTDLGPQDVRFVNELGQLNPDQLMEYVRTLQNNVYTLGIEEALLTYNGIRLYVDWTDGEMHSLKMSTVDDS